MLSILEVGVGIEPHAIEFICLGEAEHILQTCCEEIEHIALAALPSIIVNFKLNLTLVTITSKPFINSNSESSSKFI